jgi:predicted nucleotidyltransferase
VRPQWRLSCGGVWFSGRGEQDGESDLDLLVDIEEGRNLFDLAGLIDDLEILLDCPVNVVERCMLKDDAFGRAVSRDEVPL